MSMQAPQRRQFRTAGDLRRYARELRERARWLLEVADRVDERASRRWHEEEALTREYGPDLSEKETIDGIR